VFYRRFFSDRFAARTTGILPQLASLTEFQCRQAIFSTFLLWVVKAFSLYNPALPADTLFESSF